MKTNSFANGRIAPLIVSLLVLAGTEGRAGNSKVALAAFNSLVRIDQAEDRTGAREISLQAARNEVESFQVMVSAVDADIVITGAELSDLVGESGGRIGQEDFRLFKEEHVQIRRSSPRTHLPPGLYADPLVPFTDPVTGKPIEPYTRKRGAWGEPVQVSGAYISALPLEVARGSHQILWADVHVPAAAPAGTYRGTFTAVAKEGVVAELPVTLTVWDFVLPDGPTHRNHFGNFGGITRYFPGLQAGSEEFREIEMRYCAELSRHRLNPPIPEHLLPEVSEDGSLKIVPAKTAQLRNFLERFHVTDFDIPRAPFARLDRTAKNPDYKTVPPDERAKANRYYRAYYDYLKENGWEKRAYLYLWDEPNTKENYEQVLVLGAMVREAVPEIRTVVVESPVRQNSDWPELDPAVDVWCPLWFQLEAARETIAARIATGDEVWSYTALVQGPDEHRAPYWHIDRPLAVYRIPTWMNWQYRVTGLLYWSTVTGTIVDPWWNPAFRNRFNGGGYLFYPGTLCGFPGPVASIRLKVIRDSMEDWEYFELLRQRAGSQAVDEIVGQFTPKFWVYPEEPEAYFQAREKLAAAILKAKG